MKTIQKAIAMSVLSVISITGFSQLGVNVKSTTQAATSAAVKAPAVKPDATVQKTVNATSTAGGEVKAKGSSAVKAGKNKTEKAKDKVSKQKADAKISAGANVSSQSNVQGSSGNQSAQGNGNAALGANVDAQAGANGENVVNKVDRVESGAKKKTRATVEKSKETKAELEAEGRAKVKATREKVSENKPSANADAEVKSTTEVKAGKQ